MSTLWGFIPENLLRFQGTCLLFRLFFFFFADTLFQKPHLPPPPRKRGSSEREGFSKIWPNIDGPNFRKASSKKNQKKLHKLLVTNCIPFSDRSLQCRHRLGEFHPLSNIFCQQGCPEMSMHLFRVRYYSDSVLVSTRLSDING